MYYQLTGALKRRMINEVKRCFREYFPKHKDVIDFVQPQYSFDSRPQKGVVVKITGSNPRWLSADNFQGTVISHVMLSQVEDYSGHSVEWVKEDPLAVRENGGEFPSPPGIYYLDIFSREKLQQTLSDSEFQNVIDKEGKKPYYFFVDSLLFSKNEPVAESTPSNNLEGKKFFLMEDEVASGSLRVYENEHQLVSAPFLNLESKESLEILEDQEEVGLEEGKVSVEAVSQKQETFDISVNQNDLLKFEMNGITISVRLDSGFRFADEIVENIKSELRKSSLSFEEYPVSSTENGRIEIEASESLRFSPLSESTANKELGFSKGFVSPSLEGNLFNPHIEEDIELKIKADGKESVVLLYEGSIELDQLAKKIQSETNHKVSASYEMGGDYKADLKNGEIELLRPFREGSKITADYKYPADSRGPFGIEEKRSNNTAIPGTVLAFGGRMKERDKMAVVVHDKRKDVASEYGGRWDMNVSLEIITRDPTTRAEMVDGLLTYFFSLRKGSLSEEGIEITDLSSGGESEEVYEDSDQEMYFLGDISLSIRTDWAVHIPKPLIIERVRPFTMKQDFKKAGQVDSQLTLEDSNVTTTDDISLEKARNIYFVGKTKDFEDIK